MRGLLFWSLSTAAAFAVTASVFLLLAQIGSDPPERSLTPGDPPAEPPSTLALQLDQDELEELEPESAQEIEVAVTNESSRDLSNVSVTLELSTRDTARPESRYYEATLEELAAGGSATVRFDLDLSPAEERSEEEGAMEILEVRAATSEGISVVRTAILSL
ncbi:MAG: hypothetical protein H0V53_13565 [Rubrobacter sp.]|jgi:hypothetical protein|nr:hypothetical protein [Rubrobacter sp.]